MKQAPIEVILQALSGDRPHNADDPGHMDEHVSKSGISSIDALDYRAIFEATLTPHLVLAPDSTIVAVNEAYLATTMTTRTSLLGRPLFEAFPEDPDQPHATSASPIRASIQRVLDTGRPDSMPVQRYDIRDEHGQFVERYWSPVHTPVFDGAGRLTHIIHRVLDVTGFVQAQARASRMEHELADQTHEVHAANGRLQEVNAALDREVALRTAQREHLHSLLMAVPVPIMLTRMPGHRLSLRNDAMALLLGHRHAQAETLADVLGGGSELLAIVDEVYRSGQPASRPRQTLGWVAPSETLGPRFHDVYLHPLLGAHREVEGLVIAIVEVTAYVQAEAQSRAAITDLTRERELREQFMLALTHDLRTPLAAAMMANDIISRKLNDEASVQPMVARVASSLDRVDHMLRDLLDATRLSAGSGMKMEVAPCDLRDIAAAVVEEMGTLHGDRFVLQADSPIEGRWNVDQLRRVIENLCINAAKYGAPQRPVSVRLSLVDDHARIEVHNEGPAVPKERHEELFRPFSRGADDGGGLASGWGLGLTLVRGIAEAHGGSVTLESEPAQGTTFRVRLPRNRGDEA